MQSRRWLKPVLIAAAIVMGVLSSTQSRINGALAVDIGSGPHAAAISFATGLTILLVLFAFQRRAWHGMRRVMIAVRGGSLPWWGLLGGACGSMFVLAQGLTVPLLGVAVLMTSMVVGQLFGSLAIDHYGWLGTPKFRVTWMRAVGAALAVVGVAAVGAGGGVALESVGLVAFGVFGGVLISLQLAITGTVRQVAQESVSPNVLNFAVGTVVLVFAATVSQVTGAVDFTGLPQLPEQWWLYVGGAIGVTYIFLVANVVRGLGVFALSLSLVGGQLLGALGFDIAEGNSGWMLFVGVALAFVGIVVSHLAARRR